MGVWNLNVIPGLKNGKKTFYQKIFLNKIMVDKLRPFIPDLCFSDFQLRCFYFLVDGMYPFFRSIRALDGRSEDKKEQAYGMRQTSALKATERLFGFLFMQIRIVLMPCSLAFINNI